MALIQITTTSDAIAAGHRPALAQALARLVYTAEGFGESRLAPDLSWTTFEALPTQSMLPGSGVRSAPLYYVRVTTLAQAIDASARQPLGENLTRALLEAEGVPFTRENAARVWVRFIEIADGDLIVAGESTSLAGLRALVAESA